jgi:exodeoxyribonuclease V alpha subunit
VRDQGHYAGSHPGDPLVVRSGGSIANVDSWPRHIGLGKADARNVREAYGDGSARLVRENPYRLADDIHGIGFVTADSLRLMLGIAPTSTFRLHAALKYLLGLVARTEGHVYLPLGELADRTARQLDLRRATTGRWEPDPELVKAIRAYMLHFALTEDAWRDAGPSGDLEADDAHVYRRELYDAECLAADRLAQLLEHDTPLFNPDELQAAMKQAKDHQLVPEPDQRRAIATALTRQVSIIHLAEALHVAAVPDPTYSDPGARRPRRD